ncbi:MAG: hypothetical protein VB108_00460 [Anaerolineaceae bacterium]|nr:hypothetical protein [Anaerolineaceae bacterium]
MMKRIILLIAFGCLFLFAACTFISTNSDKTKKAEQPAATLIKNTQAPTDTPKPSETPVQNPVLPSATPAQTLEHVVVGYGSEPFVLYFNPQKWSTEPDGFQNGCYILHSKEFAGCNIRQLLGHGVNPDQTPLTSEILNLNGIEITYNVWRDKDTHFPAIVGYYWNNMNSSAEVFVKDNPEECLAAAQEVIKLSAEHHFAQ